MKNKKMGLIDQSHIIFT